MATRTPAVVWWIVAFKGVKALSLAALGVALLLTRHMPPETFLTRAVLGLHLSLASRIVQRAMHAVTSLTPQREVILGIAALAYASLFGTEAVGLSRRASWARWLTVVATGGLIPFEVYEIARRPTVVRIVALIVNAALVAYLIWRKDVFEKAR